jgi:hypothetical protein
MTAPHLLFYSMICMVMVPSAFSTEIIFAVTAGSAPGYQPGELPDPGYYADSVTGVAVDRKGSVWMVGNTHSQGFPQGLQPAMSSLGGRSQSAFIAKLASDGSHLTYAKVIQNATAEGIVADGFGSVYVVGHGYQVAGPIPTLQLGVPALEYSFLLKFDSAGNTVYAVYFDGQFASSSSAKIAVDPFGEAYVATQADAPTTPGAYEPPVAGARTSIIKLNSSGTALVYVAQLAGEAEGLAVDAEGAVYVTGTTGSHEFPTTTGAYQQQFANTSSPWTTAAFVTKLNPMGTALVYSTYLGGSGWEPGNWVGESAGAIAVDAHGSAYITGRTFSPDFPVTSRVFQTGVGAVFVAKLSPTGADVGYSTLFGGYLTSSNAIAVDGRGNAFITGETDDGLPVFRAPQPTYYGPECKRYSNSGNFAGYIQCGDAFAAGFDSSGKELLFSTYLTGYFFDSGSAIVADASGNQYVGGSGSLTWAATNQLADGGSAFVVKLRTMEAAPNVVPLRRNHR